ncbi:MAG TPA: acyl-CoA thioester hydrolase/BAAT C-terminal domain-containing protein [Allosphingosinicella sp.]|nr:acyl-CoA thioester hydrolase/BAAT C-terminal domain-containing protein [Allosphingosinicella sp.]
MLKPILAAGLSLAAATAAAAQAQQAVPRQPAPQCAVADTATTAEEVRANGLVAQYIRPNRPGRHPALLILGGSEGGTEGVRRLAAPFAAQGYAVLALTYFGAEGVPQNLDQIPLEYFATGLAWLAARAEVDPARLGVYGISKGGEAALLVASRNPRVRATVAGVPSNVTWQGIIRPAWDNRSSWSEGGRPLPHLAYDFSRGFTSIYALYEGALANLAQHRDAEIPVERINGAVLLISGRADRLWPSSAMSDAVVARLRAHDFRFPVQHLAFDDAGHAASSPPALGASSQGPDSFVGGTVEGNARARAESWRATLCFLRDALATPARR